MSFIGVGFRVQKRKQRVLTVQLLIVNTMVIFYATVRMQNWTNHLVLEVFREREEFFSDLFTTSCVGI